MTYQTWLCIKYWRRPGTGEKYCNMFALQTWRGNGPDEHKISALSD